MLLLLGGRERNVVVVGRLLSFEVSLCLSFRPRGKANTHTHISVSRYITAVTQQPTRRSPIRGRADGQVCVGNCGERPQWGVDDNNQKNRNKKKRFFFCSFVSVLEEFRHLHFVNLFDAGIAFDDLVISKNEEERKKQKYLDSFI
jgi:hypothetical protein